MNKYPENHMIVVDMAGNDIKIKASSCYLEQLTKMGFSPTSETLMSKTVETLAEKIDLINLLIANNALFLYGIGWYPSELIEYYKANGYNIEKYKSISWSSPQDYIIREH
ncbi:hypothetical protein [Hafnia sp. CBA7124]|uniref:hypothetical protein n=1 Tax=Hafnia sp. CBA7124 TaxID=1848580 RepID=UPI001E3B9A05|nr:hypothetical protein [Hafnia sp. CBA7124]